MDVTLRPSLHILPYGRRSGALANQTNIRYSEGSACAFYLAAEEIIRAEERTGVVFFFGHLI